MHKIQSILGFDYGTRWIGIATGQVITRTACPLKTLESKNQKPNWDQIQHVINEYSPDLLVVGLPLNAKGEEQEISKKARRFARQLEGRFKVESALVDERLTTRQVYIDSADNHQTKQQIDALSATLIAQSWLDNNPD